MIAVHGLVVFAPWVNSMVDNMMSCNLTLLQLVLNEESKHACIGLSCRSSGCCCSNGAMQHSGGENN